MILDERLEFADAATLVGTAASAAILGDVVDLGSVSRDIGAGSPVRLRIDIDTQVAASGGAANVTFALVSDSVATLDNSPTTHWSSAAIAKATLAAGYIVADIVIPSGTYERYLGVLYTPDTNNTTSGKGNAYLTFDTPKNAAYPNGI